MGQLRDASDVAHGHPVVEQRPGPVESVESDEAVEVVLHGEADQADQSVGAAVDGASGTPKLREFAQSAPRWNWIFVSVISVHTENTAL